MSFAENDQAHKGF